MLRLMISSICDKNASWQIENFEATHLETCDCTSVRSGVELQDNRGFWSGEGILPKLVCQCSSGHHQHASPSQVVRLDPQSFIIRSIVAKNLKQDLHMRTFFKWFNGSYNDITVESGLRDFVGWAWYDRTFYVDNSWTDKRIILR